MSPSPVTRPPRQLPAPIRAMLKPLADGLHLADHMLAGAAAAAVAVLVMHPMDTVKTVAQSNGISPVAAVRDRVSAGGVAALYGGAGASTASQVPAGSIKLAAFEGVSQWARRKAPNAHPSAIELASAAIAFVVCSVVLVPGEVVKQKMQAGMYASAGKCIRGIWEKERVRGFYTGYGATIMRDVPYTMLEFGLFAQFKRFMRAAVNRSNLTAQEEWAMGGLAGGCCGWLTTPLDLAKTKLMTQTQGAIVGGAGAAAVSTQYKNVLDVFVQVGRKEGVRGLFRGGGARVVWLIPFTAVYFGVHGMSKRVLLERKHKEAVANATFGKPARRGGRGSRNIVARKGS